MDIISGMGEATDFQFGLNIRMVHTNKSPLKQLEKRERGRIHGLSNFLGYPKFSQERVKLRISNLAGTFTVSMRTKTLKKFGQKERGTAHFFGYRTPLLSEEQVKLRTSNFVRIFIVSIGRKAH